MWRRRPKTQPRPTHLEHLRDQYARDALTIEEFEACAAELIELGLEDRERVIPISFDEVMKAPLYRRNLPKAPAVMGRATR